MDKVKIGSVAQFCRGVSYKKEQAKKTNTDGFVSILRANNIEANRLNFDDLVYVPSVLVQENQYINNGDIIITMSSGSKAHVGKVAIAQRRLNCSFGAFCGKLIPQNIVPRYLYYILQSNSFRRHIEHQCKGTNINNIRKSYILDYEIDLPSLPEQERIVARIEELFSQLDASVSELKTAKERLKVYRQAVVTAAYPTLTAENTCCLSELAEISGGITKGRKFENSETVFLPYMRVANVQNGYLDLTEVKQIQLKKTEIEQYLLYCGDVLYTEGGDRDKLGRGTIWRSEIENCVHQNHVFKARIDAEKALSLYVAYWSMATPARNYFYAKGKQSVNLASINKTVLSLLPIPLVPIEQQNKIVAEIESKLSVCDSIEKTVDTALQQAEALRQSILKKTFEEGLQ